MSLRLSAVFLAVATAGCGMFDKEPPVAKEIEIKKPAENAKIDFLATSSPLMNPGRDGAAMPVSMRLYILSQPDRFTAGNFFELWERDDATLGATLLTKKELFLQPGDVQRVSAPLPSNALAVGVTVGFEDYKNAKWRAIIPLQGEKTLRIRAKIDSKSVALVPQDE